MKRPAEMSFFAKTIMEEKYSHIRRNGVQEQWKHIARRVANNVMGSVNAPKKLVKEIELAIRHRKFMPGGRYLYGSGLRYHQVQNCVCLQADDSREGWADLMYRTTLALMTGAGIGVEYSDIRANGKVIRKTGGASAGPLALMQMVNESARGIIQGGNRRAAIWAGLNWQHPDIHKFITIKNWENDVRILKAKNFSFPATLDMTNVSVGLDDEFFKAIENEKHPKHSLAYSVYWATVRQMLKTAEPGFTVNTAENKSEILRNACTEISAVDDSDICNLGSINMSRVESLEEMTRLVKLATAFLTAGTVYSDVPFAKIDKMRTKNRRLGLGLMGLHEWLLMHGKEYGQDEELAKYLEIYATSDKYAHQWQSEWDLSHSIKTRAIAPTGTIALVGETSSGIEPIFCVAYKRRYFKSNSWSYQYVIDPTAKRLIDAGVSPDNIEDAYSLAENVERRIAFQAWIQRYVDHGISSTMNLPAWGSRLNNDDTVTDFGNMLLKYLPQLRGFTVYPDGARGGQPLVPVRYNVAIQHGDRVFEEAGDICEITKGGACGS